eukprot:gene4096-4779_t
MYYKNPLTITKDKIPDTVTSLVLYNTVEMLPDSLPGQLADLTLMGSDNVIQPGGLPSGLKKLVLDVMFNQPIEPGTFPDGLTHLEFGYMFNQPFDQANLPSSLTSLTVGLKFQQTLHSLPESLTHLYGARRSCLPNRLPPNLIHLDLDCYVAHPGFDSDGPLQSITLVGYIFSELISLPSSITRLNTGKKFDGFILPGSLPPNLIELVLDGDYNQQILPNRLPKTLVHLKVGERYSQPLVPGSIPKSVTQFTCSESFHHSLTRDLIPSVTHVTINITLIKNHSDRDSKFVDNIKSFIHSLLQLGIKVRCQGHIADFFINLRMIDRECILISTVDKIVVIQDTNLSVFLDHHIGNWSPETKKIRRSMAKSKNPIKQDPLPNINISVGLGALVLLATIIIRVFTKK